MKMYHEIADWWPLLSAVEDYADEAAFFMQLLAEAGLPPAPTLLELGSGGGNNAFHMKRYFAQVTLSDLSPEMLAVSRALNPECEHVRGDMRTVSLGRPFDVVFVHDAIEYMITLDDLRAAIRNAYRHCKPGGIALFVPDQVREHYAPSTEHGGHDGEGRSLRYLAWDHEIKEGATTSTTEYVYLLREAGQPTRLIHDVHRHGLHARADWLRLLRDAGFEPHIVEDPYERELFLARKPTTPG